MTEITQGGRGRRPYPPEKVRSRTIRMRVTEAEYQSLMGLSEESGVTMSEIMRHRISCECASCMTQVEQEGA